MVYGRWYIWSPWWLTAKDAVTFYASLYGFGWDDLTWELKSNPACIHLINCYDGQSRSCLCLKGVGERHVEQRQNDCWVNARNSSVGEVSSLPCHTYSHLKLNKHVTYLWTNWCFSHRRLSVYNWTCFSIMLSSTNVFHTAPDPHLKSFQPTFWFPAFLIIHVSDP